MVRVIACSNICGRSSWDFLNLYDFATLYLVAACWPTQKKALDCRCAERNDEALARQRCRSSLQTRWFSESPT